MSTYIFIKNLKENSKEKLEKLKEVLINLSLKKTFKIGLFLIVLFFTLSILNYFYISNYSKNFIFNNVKDLPYNKVGLLLGTSPTTSDGNPNQFFVARMYATKQLLDNKKIDYVLASGDNRTVAYNETKYMRKYLEEKLGVASSSIVNDNAGRRTLDSVLRSEKIFNQNSITIISQKYHNERAVFIARKNGIDAVAYNADYPNGNLSLNIWIYFRELLSRDSATLEVLFHNGPQILGEEIVIE